MTIIHRIRFYHAALAILATLSYVTGEFGIIHSWLGYGVVLVIILRLLWALSGERQVGLIRFYPSFEGFGASNIFTHPAISKIFILSIIISLIAVSLTGIAIDKGKAIGFTNVKLLANANASDHHENDGEDDDDEKEGFLTETHEFFANLMLLFVGMHVAYLFTFKRPLAKFMLFVPNRKNKET